MISYNLQPRSRRNTLSKETNGNTVRDESDAVDRPPSAMSASQEWKRRLRAETIQIEYERPAPQKTFVGILTLNADFRLIIFIHSDAMGRQRHISLFSIPENSDRSMFQTLSRDNIARINRPMSRTDIFYPGSIANLPLMSTSRARLASTTSVSHQIASTLNLDQVMPPADDMPSADIKVCRVFLQIDSYILIYGIRLDYGKFN